MPLIAVPFFFFHHLAPFPFISVTFDVSRAATFCIIQKADFLEAPGLTRSRRDGAFRFRSGRFLDSSLIKLDESRRRSGAVICHVTRSGIKRTRMQGRTVSSIFLGNVRLTAITLSRRNLIANVRILRSSLSLSLGGLQTFGYTANFKPGFSDLTDR